MNFYISKKLTFSCLILLSINSNADFPLSKLGFPVNSSAYLLPNKESANLNLALKDARAIQLTWMCAAFKDFPQGQQGQLTFAKRKSDGALLLQIPFDLAVDSRQIWLLVNEFVRTDIKNIKGDFFYEDNSPDDSARQQKLADLAKNFVDELKKRKIDVPEIKRTSTPTASDRTDILAKVALPTLAPTFRTLLGRSEVSTDFVVQTLKSEFQRQKLSPPSNNPTLQELDQCVSKVLGNFQTAPEFLTLIPAAIGKKDEPIRRLTHIDTTTYFIFTVFRKDKLQKLALLTSDQPPTDPKKFEAEFPNY